MANGITTGAVDIGNLARGSPERKAMGDDYFGSVAGKLEANGITSRPHSCCYGMFASRLKNPSGNM